MANFVSQVKLPNNTTYIIRDPNARPLDNNDFDTINVTELNAGDLIVTGVGRFTNGLYGNLIGNADTASSATKATQDESGNNIKSTYANAISISNHTITLKNKNGTSLGTVTVPDNNTTYAVATGTANGKIKVTPSSGDAYEVSVYGLKSAAYKDVTDTYSETGTDPVSGKAVKSAIDGLPSPMVFKGTVGDSSVTVTWANLPAPTAANEGFTYKATSARTTSQTSTLTQNVKVGDTIISNTTNWVVIPSGDEPSGTVTSVAVANGGGLSVSGSPITSSGTITISHADTSSQASVNNSGRTYIQDITLDTYGHVTGITSATETVVNTDRYVNSAAFADATSADANNPVKMTLTRAGSDTASVTAYIPKVSSSSAGVAPKGAAVSSQSQTTKFLREDGTWAAPSYTTDTNTHRPIQMNGTEILGNNTTALNLKAGTNVSLSNSSGTVTIAATDTKNTAGSTDTSSKIFLIGATSQAANPQTYSQDTAYVGTDGCLYSGGSKVLTAHQDISGKVSKTGDTMTGNLTLNSASGNSPALIFTRDSSLTDWKIVVNAGKLSFLSATDATTWTERAYFADNSGNFNCASVATTGNITAGGYASITGNVECNTIYANRGANGTAGGISLYSNSAPSAYGIANRNTTQGGKFGYVQGDWAGYYYMSGAVNRGWIWRHGDSTNVASISGEGHAAFNGSVTIGANTTNTSGVRQVYNSTTKSLDFVFVA